MALCGARQIATPHTVLHRGNPLGVKRFEQICFAFKIKGLGNETVSCELVDFGSTQYSPFVYNTRGGQEGSCYQKA